jgi:hypothetical protein
MDDERPAVRLAHAIDVDVTRDFAWRYRTDVANWSDSPATFAIEGPFRTGASGTTTMPGQDPVRWRVAAMHEGEAFVIEMPLDGATLAFEWRFEARTPSRTRVTHTITLTGPNAAAFADQVTAGFASTLATGLEKVAADMVSAARASGSMG